MIRRARNRAIHVVCLPGLLALALAAGCNEENGSASDGGLDGQTDGLPPKICRSPKPLGSGPYFKDVTKTYKLDPSALAITGNRLASADLDGDRYPDLVVHQGGSNNRDDLTSSPAKRYKYILLNKAASGGGRMFTDQTKPSGFTAIRGGGEGRASHFAIFADVDNDGDLDAFSGTYVDASSTAKIPDPGDRNEILLNDGKSKFTLGPKSGLYHTERYSTTSAAFLDYDRDGNVDLFVGFWYEVYGYIYCNQDRLYRGNGDGTFTDVTGKMGLTTHRDSGYDKNTNSRPTYGVTVCDVDGDGDTDLLVSAYGRQKNMLWRNDGANFVEIGDKSGFSADDKKDYTDNEYYKCYCKATGKCTAAQPMVSCPATSYWNPGSDDKDWRLGGNTFTTVCADFDNDGDMDLFNAEIRHWWAGSSSDPSQLLVNSGKSPVTFSRPGNSKMGLLRTHTEVDWNEGDISAALFDFDADGLQDLILMDSDYPNTYTRLFRQKTDHTFEEMAKRAGINHERGQEVTVADLDGDGDLDVVMGTSTMRAGTTGPKVAQVTVYENLVGSESNWLKVRLVGSGKGGANSAAIGAWVRVEAGGVKQLREVTGGYGHFGLQNDLVLYFGLGSSCEVDKLEVRWPDAAGSTTTLKKVQANYLVQIDQKSGTLSYVTEQ